MRCAQRAPGPSRLPGGSCVRGAERWLAMATAPQQVGGIERKTAPDPSQLSLRFSILRDIGGFHLWRLLSSDGSGPRSVQSFASRAGIEQAAKRVIDNAHSVPLVPAWDEDRQVAFTHPGSGDSEDGTTDTVLTRPSCRRSRPLPTGRPTAALSAGTGCGRRARGRHRCFFEIGAEEPNELVMGLSLSAMRTPVARQGGEKETDHENLCCPGLSVAQAVGCASRASRRRLCRPVRNVVCRRSRSMAARA